jgi:hypothetical protein
MKTRISQRGFLEVDLLVAMAILTLAILPLAAAFAHERTLLHQEYCRSVANELLDGEMEILLAGAGRDLPDGSQVYPVRSPAADNLPAGHFELTKTGRHLRLEWQANRGKGLGHLAREGDLP